SAAARAPRAATRQPRRRAAIRLRVVSTDGNASDPLTGREDIAGYRIAADQSAGHPRERRAVDRFGGLRASAAFWDTTPALLGALPFSSSSLGGVLAHWRVSFRPRSAFHKPLGGSAVWNEAIQGQLSLYPSPRRYRNCARQAMTDKL